MLSNWYTLSWDICLNDTYKQDWHAFVQAFKKQFASQKTAYFAQIEALNLGKKTMNITTPIGEVLIFSRIDENGFLT